jgi:hypothetical protein
MKKSFIAAASAFTMATTVVAEPRTFYSEVTCNSDNRIAFDLVEKKHGEMGMAMGRAILKDARTQKIHKVDMVLALNVKTNTYTIIGVFEDGTGCILVTGMDFARYVEKDSI